MRQLSDKAIQEELIARVSALDGRQHEVNANRLSLRATVDALSECTNVDRDTINRIADQLAVLPDHLPDNEHDNLIERNNRRAKFIGIGLVTLFCFSMFKWFNVTNNIKSALHDTSTLQSRISEFHLRTGRYPYSFEQIHKSDHVPNSLKSIEMGPEGQLLMTTKGFFGANVVLTPNSNNGSSRWQCTTNASLMFIVTKWVCGYGSTQFKV